MSVVIVITLACPAEFMFTSCTVHLRTPTILAYHDSTLRTWCCCQQLPHVVRKIVPRLTYFFTILGQCFWLCCFSLQWVIPFCLTFWAFKLVCTLNSTRATIDRHVAWVVAVFVWATTNVFCVDHIVLQLEGSQLFNRLVQFLPAFLWGKVISCLYHHVRDLLYR